MGKKITPEEYEQELLDDGRGIVALEPYQGRHTKIMHQCEQGHEWSTAPNNIKRGHGCPRCSGKVPKPYEEWLAENRPDITALEPYGGADTKIMHQCDRGHQPWSVTPHSIKSAGTGCPLCAAERRGKHPAGYWTLERCMEDAKAFDTRKEWGRGPINAYEAAQRNGWLDQCCEHMERLIKPKGYWTLERCKEDALQYETRKDWERGSPSARFAAYRNGWLDQCCGHMVAGDSASDYDAVYVYEIGDALGWTGLHKTGLTSWRNGDERIRTSNRKNGTDYRIVALIRTTKGDAKKIERAILDSGELFTDLPDTFVVGRTEVRRFGPRAMETINQLAVMSGYKEAA